MPGYISEFQYYGLSNREFIEVAVPTGTDVSAYSVVLYKSDGTIVDSFGLGDSESTIAGKDVYTIDSNTAGFNSMYGQGEMYLDDALALVDDTGAVVQFISYWNNTVNAVEGPAAGMTSVDVGTASSFSSSLQSDDGGATYYKQWHTNKGTIPACYAPDTEIETPDGAVPIQDLRAGDWVVTENQGYQRVCWVWSGHQPLDDIALHQKPVLVSAGSLAPGVPKRDLIVSGQHRIAVGLCNQLQDAFDTPAFVPAKALVGLPGIRHMAGKKSIRWHHFLCDEHQIVFANAVASESLLLRPQSVKSLNLNQRSQLPRLLSMGLSENKFQSPALPVVGVRSARETVARWRFPRRERCPA